MDRQTKAWMGPLRALLTAVAVGGSCGAALASPLAYDVVPILPNGYSPAQSLASIAVGISDDGFVAGNGLGGPFAFDGSHYALVRIFWPVDYPQLQGITKNGWVYGNGSAGQLSWGGNVETSPWESAAGWQVNCCNIWAADPNPVGSNPGESAVDAETVAMLAQMNMRAVSVNAHGQIAANSIVGQQIAYLLNPVNLPATVQEPGTVALVGAALLVAIRSRRRSG